jgi:hypothetical protein
MFPSRSGCYAAARGAVVYGAARSIPSSDLFEIR